MLASYTDVLNYVVSELVVKMVEMGVFGFVVAMTFVTMMKDKKYDASND